jgi:ribonuclease HII
MTPVEIQLQAVELLDRLAQEAISPRKRTELANAVKKQTIRLQVKQTDEEIASNLNHLHSHISKALQAFPNLKDKYPVALPLLAEIETSARKSTGGFKHPDGKSGV